MRLECTKSKIFLFYAPGLCQNPKLWTLQPLSSHSLSFFISCKNLCPLYGSIFQLIFWLPGLSPKPFRGTSVPTFYRELPPLVFYVQITQTFWRFLRFFSSFRQWIIFGRNFFLFCYLGHCMDYLVYMFMDRWVEVNGVLFWEFWGHLAYRFSVLGAILWIIRNLYRYLNWQYR